MKKKYCILTSIFIAFFYFINSTTASANVFNPTDPIMPIDKIKAGMRGKAYTVISGTEITPFEVSILGILPRKTNPKNLILFKIEDKEVNANGGVAAGMSGSPIYVEGKLIGAIGYGWSFSEGNLGLATPIEDMISALDWPDRIPGFDIPQLIPTTPISQDLTEVSRDKKQKTKKTNDSNVIDIATKKESEQNKYSSIQQEKLSEEISLINLLALPEDKKVEVFSNRKLIPLKMPILVDGMSSELVKELESKMGCTMLPYGSTSASSLNVKSKNVLKPGAAIGVALAWGDILMGGIGTLSAVDKNGRFLAFAHPMFNAGAVSYPATEATIVKIIPSLNNTFKLGSLGNIIGTVTQDRPVAIAGKIGQYAPASSYTLKFKDEDTANNVLKRFQTLSDSFTGPTIGVSGIKALIENEWGRRGEGTASVKFKFSGGNMKESWERKNIFFSSNSLVEAITEELEGLTKVFSLNQFQEIRPFGVDVEVSVTRDPKIIFIEKIELVDAKDTYAPGEKLELDVTTRIWRQQAKKKRISMIIPKDAAMMCEISVRSGKENVKENNSKSNGLSSITNISDLLRELDAVEKNNQIIAEINAPVSGKPKNKGESGPDLPSNMTDSRLSYEIQQEKIKEGTLVITETESFVEGNLKKFVKISEESQEENIVSSSSNSEKKKDGKIKETDR